MASRQLLFLAAFAMCVDTQAQFHIGAVVGGGYFTAEERAGYTHEEQLCPEFGLLLGMKTGRTRLGLAVVHSSRSTTDRTEDSTLVLLQEDQQTRSVTAGLYALYRLHSKEKTVDFLAGPSVDLVFPYRTDVQRSFSDSPDREETNAFVNTTPPGLRLGLRFRAEWHPDPQLTPFAQLGLGYTLRQSFTEDDQPSSSTTAVIPPTDKMDYHLWLGLSIAVGAPDCDCPAFH